MSFSPGGMTVQAVGVNRVSDNTSSALEDSGNANPNFDLRYDASLGGYIFNLSTAGLFTGTWNLNFKAGNDHTIHTVQFQVK